jgi:hypothetical protein
MEHAAALLVQLVVNSDERLRTSLKDQASNPKAAAEFLRPWYQAMLMMIKKAEDFDQGPSSQRTGI